MPQLAKSNTGHIPVLKDEVLEFLSPKLGETYLDLTAGYGGHARVVLSITKGKAVLVDRDKTAVEALLVDKRLVNATVERTDFLSASQGLVGTGREFDLILADLGVSSVHLNESGRGFSFQKDELLDMRMDASQKLTAQSVVNSYSEAKLAEIIRSYGDEPKARQLANLIIRSRPLSRTLELADLAKRAWPGHSKVHPATRLFQAIRIEVNDELNQLKSALELWLKLLAPGGRLVVISFHSHEDRLVKTFLADKATGYDGELTLLTTRPVVAGQTEIAFNPRARSAKLRAAVKIKIKGEADAYSGQKQLPGVQSES